MQNNFKSKCSLAVVFILIIIGLFYLLNSKTPFFSAAPTKVFAPENYPAGTTVSLYKNTPPGFPREIISENKELNYSGTVQAPDGGTQITVSYISDKNIPELVKMYKISLPKNGWTISESAVEDKVATISAFKTIERLIITTATAEDKGTMVTFQYEK
ncbi:MAG: hypothetical protein AAB661_01675 [Patescibacteria group bacterium]